MSVVYLPSNPSGHAALFESVRSITGCTSLEYAMSELCFRAASNR